MSRSCDPWMAGSARRQGKLLPMRLAYSQSEADTADYLEKSDEDNECNDTFRSDISSYEFTRWNDCHRGPLMTSTPKKGHEQYDVAFLSHTDPSEQISWSEGGSESSSCYYGDRGRMPSSVNRSYEYPEQNWRCQQPLHTTIPNLYNRSMSGQPSNCNNLGWRQQELDGGTFTKGSSSCLSTQPSNVNQLLRWRKQNLGDMNMQSQGMTQNLNQTCTLRSGSSLPDQSSNANNLGLLGWRQQNLVSRSLTPGSSNLSYSDLNVTGPCETECEEDLNETDCEDDLNVSWSEDAFSYLRPSTGFARGLKTLFQCETEEGMPLP